METVTFLIIILVIAFMIVVYQVAKRRSGSAGPSVDPKKPPTPKKTPDPPKPETRKEKDETETGALSVAGTAFLDMEMSKPVRRCRNCDAELRAGVMDCPVCGSRGA